MSLWITGTDTGVGKTVVSAIVALRYGGGGASGAGRGDGGGGRLAYWKPVSTGGDADRDRRTVERWLAGAVDVLPETYRFAEPASPHLAARLEGVAIDPERILADLVAHGLADASRNLVIEGAGGVLVPLGDDGPLIADLIAESALPALVVARSTLGTINHTLLTLEALRARRVEVAGVVFNGPEHAENRRAVERLGRTRVIDRVAPLDGIWSGERGATLSPSRGDIRRAAAAFDARGALADYLGGAPS